MKLTDLVEEWERIGNDPDHVTLDRSRASAFRRCAQGLREALASEELEIGRWHDRGELTVKAPPFHVRLGNGCIEVKLHGSTLFNSYPLKQPTTEHPWAKLPAVPVDPPGESLAGSLPTADTPGEWRPATRGNALELFLVPCRADFWFHGQLGEQAHCRIVEGGYDDRIGVECSSDDRQKILAALENLAALMRKAGA